MALALALAVSLAPGASPARGSAPAATGTPSPAACPVTQPNGKAPSELEHPEQEGGYGNDALWTNLWMWGQGEVVVPTSHVLPDGSFGEMKWAWYRYRPGELTIGGRRLDAPAPPLRAWAPDGYGDRGFQVSGLVFPTGGCWEVTGRVGKASLTFVTWVVPPPGEPGSNATPVALDDGATCWVTAPNGAQPPEGMTVAGRGPGGHGDDRLWTNLWLWGEGRVEVPASHVQPDRSLGRMKWSWWVGQRGRLKITGRRLDAPAPPLRAETSTGVRLDLPLSPLDPYVRGSLALMGFLPMGLTFPAGGCWEITGEVGDTRLTFVTLVVAPESVESVESEDAGPDRAVAGGGRTPVSSPPRPPATSAVPEPACHGR